MTPEKARELLRFAGDGPWEGRPSEHCYCCLDVVSKDGVVVAKDSHNCDAPLVVAAPDLAKLVAGLRYVYAVQLDFTDKGGPIAYFQYNDTNFYPLTPLEASWFKTLEDAQNAIECEISDRHSPTIVRCLVGDPEVTL